MEHLSCAALWEGVEHSEEAFAFCSHSEITPVVQASPAGWGFEIVLPLPYQP